MEADNGQQYKRRYCMFVRTGVDDMTKEKRLSDDVADSILSMITIEKRFKAGDKLPNENELSGENLILHKRRR